MWAGLDALPDQIASTQIEVSVAGTRARKSRWMPGSGNSSTASSRALCVFPREHQDEIVGGHLNDLAQGKAAVCGEPFDIGDIAHAPLRIRLAQAGVEHGVRDRGVLAVALERPIEQEETVASQSAAGAGDPALRDS